MCLLWITPLCHNRTKGCDPQYYYLMVIGLRFCLRRTYRVSGQLILIQLFLENLPFETLPMGHLPTNRTMPPLPTRIRTLGQLPLKYTRSLTLTTPIPKTTNSGLVVCPYRTLSNGRQQIIVSEALIVPLLIGQKGTT